MLGNSSELPSIFMRALFLIPLLLASTLARAELPETDWLELMPKSDQKALEQMPEIDHNSPEAMGTFTDKGGLKQSKGLPAVMYSTKTVAAMNGKQIRLGGYPVPLESDAKGNSTLFFLVPYPGACIHVPPPPPNQLVLVRYPKGLKIDDIYTPLWVSGALKVEKVSNDLADAAYALDAQKVRVVEDADL
ncbi:DUF3299 domain-containing protein [Pseudomonas kermanshahensis]|jgi:hypothetical protein|uniref:DUF3299 domain-containing protein n=2 Tax=Pseudomonas TaxID=286 RepID=UPI000A1646DF|nr:MULTISPECIES: DUF3299 domain-containing protein [Pseudomonas]GLO54158.1 hypothetical protein PPUJ20066_01940 [Pseudomonas putida]MCX2688026.1 DUF3299 domain-containing protein [Pseudomonas sp. DCB_AW]MDE4536937.1 DUF3299 domain-containing protein [Pseudomonas sp. ITEM 17296]USS55988.1 DUF3299 domain-containing protein [Pseudomonas kermanshahensis]UVL66871.1 DUF3299 domain-containing protein [Pseudomonas sp. B21-031]